MSGELPVGLLFSRIGVGRWTPRGSVGRGLLILGEADLTGDEDTVPIATLTPVYLLGPQHGEPHRHH